VFALSDDPSSNGGASVDYEYSGINLSNTSDELTLEVSGLVIDTIVFSSSTHPFSSGVSMQLDADVLVNNPTAGATLNNIASNWCASSATFGMGDLGSPGNENDSCGGSSADADGDGFFGDDCDDSDPNVYPGNLSSEDDPFGCYLDSDGDGYGDENPLNGDIDAGSDCDDSDASVNPGSSNILSDCDPGNDSGSGLTYDDDILPIFQSNSCTACHGSSGGLTISFNNIVGVTDSGTGLSYIEPGSPNDSYLYLKILGQQSTVSGGGGGQMGNLSQNERDTIEQWILDGAAEN